MSNLTPGPDHAAEPAEVEYATLEVADSAPEFLTLPVRRVLYIAALAGAVAAPILAVTNPEYAAAIVTGSSLLTTAAVGGALASPRTSK
jgi:hypothetical protein